MQGAGKHLWVLESFLGGIVKTRDVPSDSAVKSLRAMQETQETQIRSLGRKDPLEEGPATHPSVLAWRIPWAEEPGGLQSSTRLRERTMD